MKVKIGDNLFCIKEYYTEGIFFPGKYYKIIDDITQENRIYYKVQFGAERYHTWWIGEDEIKEFFKIPMDVKLNSNIKIL